MSCECSRLRAMLTMLRSRTSSFSFFFPLLGLKFWGSRTRTASTKAKSNLEEMCKLEVRLMCGGLWRKREFAGPQKMSWWRWGDGLGTRGSFMTQATLWRSRWTTTAAWRCNEMRTTAARKYLAELFVYWFDPISYCQNEKPMNSLLD